MRKLTEDEHWHFVKEWGEDQLGRWGLLATVVQIAGRAPVDALHRHESLLAERLKDSSLKMINRAPFVKTYGLSPLFPPGTRNTVDRVKAFAQAIYPIWEPIVREAQEAAADEHIGTINDVAVLHACEDAIILSGHHINRAGAAETKLNERKAKVLKTLSQAEQAIDWQSKASGDDNEN